MGSSGGLYSLTKKGRKMYRNPILDPDEMKIINFLKENKSATKDQLEVITDEGWLVRSLDRRGFIKED